MHVDPLTQDKVEVGYRKVIGIQIVSAWVLTSFASEGPLHRASRLMRNRDLGKQWED